MLETLRLEDGRYTLLEEHLARMERSAGYFKFTWSIKDAAQALNALAQQHPHGAWRVRLVSDTNGAMQAQAFALAPTTEPITVNISNMPLDTMGRGHEFLMHKTTRRAHYDERLIPGPDVFDTLLVNERGEITEFTRGNVAARIEGQWTTPPLECGLLPGTARAAFLAQGRLVERVLTVADLAHVQELAFINSVRGWLRAIVPR